MRKVGKIKLNQFGQDELDRRKLNALKGGCGCSSGNCGDCGGTSDWTYFSDYKGRSYHY